MSDLQSDYEYNSIIDSRLSKVRGKFRCTVKMAAAYSKDTIIHLSAVYSDDPKSENKAFTDATPSGFLQMQIADGKPAADLFVLGREYYLDFTPA